MLVSILMSVYNGEATLAAAMDSILSQTLKDFELIVCDDGSKDRTWEILCGCKERDSRVKLLQNEKNLGLGSSLNRCLEVANGRYVARQDADDVSAPNRLERTVDYLRRKGVPYAGCGVYVFDESGVWSRRMFPEHINRHIIAQKNPFFHPTMLFQREVLEQAGGYRVTPQTRRTEDYDLVMRLAAQGIIGQNLQEYLYYVNEPAQAYQRHTLKTRWYEVQVRLYGLRQMRSPLRDYIYVGKPVLMSMVPHKLLRRVKRIQWQDREKG